jgi:hypothetical protein
LRGPFRMYAAHRHVRCCVAWCLASGAPRVRSHGRFRKRGTESRSESGAKWMSAGAERQCGRVLWRAAASRSRSAASAAPPGPPPWATFGQDSLISMTARARNRHFGPLRARAPIQTRHRNPIMARVLECPGRAGGRAGPDSRRAGWPWPRRPAPARASRSLSRMATR